ncbi:hypothetical protein POM88_043369 [Heracleum sosnowskyi]|uniref:Uncharacterized protein n=1 Tax=Heracleum sosnowskyi TaxID=360622 RepID=A0AAD8H0Y5_9APIA|nr:hypothetical protein POM88_043369 [Heracleum sosnowskyi]
MALQALNSPTTVTQPPLFNYKTLNTTNNMNTTTTLLPSSDPWMRKKRSKCLVMLTRAGAGAAASPTPSTNTHRHLLINLSKNKKPALGGHKRRHYEGNINAKAASGSAATVVSSQRREFEFDLNLPASPEEEEDEVLPLQVGFDFLRTSQFSGEQEVESPLPKLRFLIPNY